jgi:predicted DNA-binding protein
MMSIRLSKELEERLNSIAERENITKSEVVKEALEEYIVDYEQKANPYDLGKEFFGKYGSGQGDLSVTYKQKVRSKIDQKMSR